MTDWLTDWKVVSIGANVNSLHGCFKWLLNARRDVFCVNKKKNEIDKIEIGGITNSIPIGNGYLIIKVDDKRKIKSKIDIDKETAILVQKETDRQLNQHSVNFFNKLKKNIFIYEL